MDVVSWRTSRSQESFSRSTCPTTCAPTSTPTSTLSKLASLIAQADPKQQHTSSQRQQPTHSPSYVCGECGKTFSHATDVLQHQEQEHSLPKPHQCASCGMEFSLRSSLQLHRCDRVQSECERCHGSSPLGSPCPTCRTRSAEPVRLQSKPHPRQPHVLDRSPYTCAPCGKGFSQKQALLHHQQTGCSPSPSTIIHANCLPDDSPPASESDSSQSDSDSTEPGSDAIGSCRLSSGTFSAQRHERNRRVGKEKAEEEWKFDEAQYNNKKSKKEVLTCRSCDMVFSSTTKLYVHRKEKHRREKSLRRREQRPPIKKRRRAVAYPCQVCSQVFLHHLSLRKHLKEHNVPYIPKGSLSAEHKVENKTVKAVLERSRKKPLVSNYAKEREDFPCPSCAEVFPLQKQLNEHMELHQSSVMQRQCSVCSHEMDSSKWSGSKRQRLYHCVLCQQGYSELDAFLQHCQEHLRAKVDEDRISCSQLASKVSHPL